MCVSLAWYLWIKITIFCSHSIIRECLSNLFDSHQLKGDIFAIFVKALAAAEAAIGLSILSSSIITENQLVSIN
jgi:NADH:ubiquinone oxidoreductase subunit K